MKYKWVCTCEIGSSERVEKNFKSFEEVNRYVRNIISKYVDITAYINELKSYGNYKYFLDRAKFLTKYIKDPSFPYSEADFPLENREDYDDYNTYFEDSEDFDDEPYIKECFDEFEDFYLAKELLDLRDIGVDFMSEFVLPDSNTFEDLRVSFEGYLDVIVKKQSDWGKSSHPIMVLQVLQNASEPLLQEDIRHAIYWKFEEAVHRNSIGRIINMLKELGFDITWSKEGYLLTESDNPAPSAKKEISFGSSANSVMILCALQSSHTPLTRNDIVKKIKERFYHDIDVKTVGRNVELLKGLGYEIKKFGNKGYLLQK